MNKAENQSLEYDNSRISIDYYFGSVKVMTVFNPFSCFSSPQSRAVALAALLCAVPAVGGAVGIMVNEYRAGTGGSTTAKMATDDFIEFVLTENATSADLASLTFGDTTHNTKTMISVFQFDKPTLDGVLAASGQTSFLAGTIIVVKGSGLGGQNLSYDPQVSNVGNADAWSIELVAGLGATDHAETVIDGVLDIDRRGTVVWVSTDNPPSSNIDTSGFIAAIGHDDNPGAIANAVIAQFGAGSILNAAFPTARTVQNTGTDAVALTASTTSTMGASNNATNQAWIENSLRAAAVPEPSRAVLSLIAITLAVARRRRSRVNGRCKMPS